MGNRLLTLVLLSPLAACAAQPPTSVRDLPNPNVATDQVSAASGKEGAAAEAAAAEAARSTSGNPLRPGLWEFTRAGGMAANSLGKHCINAADLSKPRSRVNGYLTPEEKQQCEAWNISWQGSSASYDGVCNLRGNKVSIKGQITASAEYYSDTQQQARDESGFAQAVKDIINGRRIGECQN